MKQQEYYFEIEDNASSEVIVWNKYPEETPPDNIWYLVDDGTGICEKAFWQVDDWHKKHWRSYYAWAELPKGWKEEQE